jgi:hypothetical protein
MYIRFACVARKQGRTKGERVYSYGAGIAGRRITRHCMANCRAKRTCVWCTLPEIGVSKGALSSEAFGAKGLAKAEVRWVIAVCLCIAGDGNVDFVRTRCGLR